MTGDDHTLSSKLSPSKEGANAMSQKRLDDRLHLPSLSIKGFRGIKELSIERLGRVTLLAGKNSVGKTTVLDAVRVYAARGHYKVLSELLESRQELAIAEIQDVRMHKRFVPDFAALFHGRDVSRCARISIGPKSDTGQLRIEETPLDDEQASNIEQALSLFIRDGYTQAFKVVFQDTEQILPWVLPIQGSDAARTVERYGGSAYLYSYSLLGGAAWPSPIGCQPLGPGLLSNKEIVRFWNAIALTDDEDRAMQALRLILGSDLERVAVIRDDISDDVSDVYEKPDVEYVQRVVAKLQGQARPVPLQSLGDGALHLAGTALALTNSRDGFLLIDEVENGIHHSVQPDFWRMVFKTAHANNVQVIATTHSFDCVRGFAQALTECEEVEGALVRLEREDEEMWAVEYSERNLKVAAKQHIEVR
ncbi:MAG: AAA family ATPase [Gemmatimonadetes bacterium]|nr:AAA family ATPase [Gemmatimonadota bacterium]MYC70782.1 AAA family ATPase [Gemmatimonadota bacterium]MYI60976.1 AAA family ATPase [Gemmatimonadota bacterium]